MLAVHMRNASRSERSGDLLEFYIRHEFAGDGKAVQRQLLLQAYELKALIPLIDGIDE